MTANLDMSLDEMISDGGRRRKRRERSESSSSSRDEPVTGTVVQVAKRVYVGNLSYDTQWQRLKDHFRTVGNVIFCNVLSDKGKGKGWSAGSGVVEFERPEEAAKAIRKLHDSILDGRPLIVREDRDDRDLKPGSSAQTVSVTISNRGGGAPAIRDKDRVGSRFPPPGSRFPPPGKAKSKGAKDSVNLNGVRVGKRCYVGNLSYHTTWQTLKDHFRQIGPVVFCNVMDTQEGVSKGCGIVEFEAPRDAARAIDKLHDSYLDGRLLVVREDREDKDLKNGYSGKGVYGTRGKGAPPRAAKKRRRSSSSSSRRSDSDEDSDEPREESRVRVARRVYVGNLQFDTTWQELKDHFRAAGEVVFANVIGASGSGIVEFQRPQEAKFAIENLFDTKINGRRIIVREDREDRDLQRGSDKGTVVARRQNVKEDGHKRRRYS